jgi:lipopolysaccharide transport system permease protein
METRRQPSFLSLLNPWVPISTLWRHRELLWQFTLRNVELRHKGSLLGFVWAVLNPLIMLTLYVFVFGFVFGGKFGVIADETKWDYGLGMFLGLTIFQLLAEAIAVAPSVIAGSPNFVKKVVFPLEILPAAAVGAAVVHVLITLAMVLLGALISGRLPSFETLLLPVILVSITGYALGFAWLIAALGVFFRDIGQLVNALITGMMFASAIFYPAALIQTQAPAAWAILKFNPLLQAVEMARDVVLWNRPLSASALVGLFAGGGLIAMLGFACFARLKRAFADVI